MQTTEKNYRKKLKLNLGKQRAKKNEEDVETSTDINTTSCGSSETTNLLQVQPQNNCKEISKDLDTIEYGSPSNEYCSNGINNDFKITSDLLLKQHENTNQCHEIAICITSIAIRKWLSVIMICGFGVSAMNLCFLGSSSEHQQQVDMRVNNNDQSIMLDWAEQQQIPQLQQYNRYNTYQPLWTMGNNNNNKYKKGIPSLYSSENSEFAFAQYSGIATTDVEKTRAEEQNGARGDSWAWVERKVPQRGPTRKWVEKKKVNPGKEGLLSDANALGVSDLNGYKDVWDPHQRGDQAVFWHIAKAGGSTVKNVLGTCHRFTMATEAGIRKGHDLDTKIAVVRPNSVKGQDSTPFINVDPTTIHGLERAARMGLAESNLADTIVTPFFHHAEILFQDQNRGRLFSLFRNPIERSVSMFYYLQIATWEETYNPEFQKMTLLEFAQSEMVEDNWMVRRLSNTIRGKLNEDHFKTSIDVIRRKFLVGTLSKLEESLERFEKFFGWKFRVNPPNQENCRTKLLSVGANTNAKKQVKEESGPGSKVYELLAERNLFDLRLYEYVENLFEEQGQFVNDIPDGFRNIDASCSKCVPPTFPKIMDIEDL